VPLFSDTCPKQKHRQVHFVLLQTGLRSLCTGLVVHWCWCATDIVLVHSCIFCILVFHKEALKRGLILAFYRMSFDWIHWSQGTVTLTTAQNIPDWKSNSYWGEFIIFNLVRFVVLVEIMTLSCVSGLLNRAPWIWQAYMIRFRSFAVHLEMKAALQDFNVRW